MPRPLLIAFLVALVSTLVVQEVGGVAPLITLPLERRTLHNSVSHPPASHWENIKNGLRAQYGYGKAKFEAIEAIQRREELAKRAMGSFDLVDQNWDTHYLVSINIGTPPQKFNVLPHTGSSETWVFGSQCVACTNGTRFDPSKSTTYVPSGQNTTLKFGSGSVVVNLANETISMGPFRSERERISTASQSSQPPFLQGSASGMLGLGFPALMASDGVVPWWIRLIRDGQLGQSETLFAIWLARYWGTPRQSATQELPGGQFTLGGINSTLFTGQINYIPLSMVSWWTIPMDSVVLDGREIVIPVNAKNAVIETGTALVGGPKEVLDQVFGSINGSRDAGSVDPRYAGYYMAPCSTLNTVSLGLKFGGQTYVFSGIDLILEDLSTSTPSLAGFCLSSLFILGNALDSGIVGTSGPAWVVGVAFLKNVYSVYRYETTVAGAISGSVGFARLSGVDGRLTTNGATLYSTATSASAFNIPSGLSTPGSGAPIPDPFSDNGGRNRSSGRLQSRRSEYGFLVVGVSLLLSLV